MYYAVSSFGSSNSAIGGGDYNAIASRPTGTKAIEGPSVVKRNGYYCLFASYDTCCAGTSSTYKVKVGRACSSTTTTTARTTAPRSWASTC
ncbi:hypothetical protein GCM10009577_42820 [Streptomyces javensis]